MKLKKLEITGFKSFAEKSGIEFPQGISAIVGPNGCGKSNIVDALKWAMGEQSVKQLRGKSMADVIFAGTNGRQPLNMAEVSLILSNENGTGPEDFRNLAEIMITRRLYRSGESGYLINKRPCRLKDITNIFLGSGMGAKSYAVIQQGNIGAITDAGPDERRFFIEEAAGITRYKQRKTETLRKLEATHQNLLRAKDIVAEVERQMNSVKRQAKKAQRYKNYQDQVRELDVFLALHYYDDYTRQIEETSAFLKELKDADMQHVSKIKQLDAAVEDIKLKRWQKDQEISAQKAEKFKAQREVDRLENDLSHLREDVKRLSTEVQELKAAHQDLEEKNQNMLSEVAQVEAENVELREKIKTRKASLEKERKDSEDIRERLSNLNQALDTCKANLMNLATQEAKYKTIHQNAANTKQSLKRRLKRMDEEVALADKKAKECETRETQAKEELEFCRQEIEVLSRDIRVIREQLDEKSKSLGEHIKSVQSLEFERGKIRSRYSALKKMEENFEGYKAGVKAIMKGEFQHPMPNAHSPEPRAQHPATGTQHPAPGIIGLTVDIIEPEPSFETAVEAVLGESLQYVLVKDQEIAMAAIAYLQTAAAGRSGFIPVSEIRNLSPTSPIKNVGDKLFPRLKMSGTSIGDPLLNHVSVKAGFEKVGEALLGHVTVAENMGEALERHASDRGNGTAVVVTKQGDCISHQGIMIGGSQENLAGILAKKQELKELERRITDLDQHLATGRQRQKEMESDVRATETDLQRGMEQKNRATRDETDAERAFYKVTEELKHARRHLEMVRLEQDQLTDEEGGIDEEIEKYNKVLIDVENDIKAAQKRIEETTGSIRTVSAEMENFDKGIVDLKLELTALNAQLENSDSTLRRLRQFREDGVVRLEQLSRDIVIKEQKQGTSEEKITEYDRTLSSLYETLKTVERSLELNEVDFQAIDSNLQESDSSISDIKTRREETLEKIRTLELEQSQRKIRQENIASQILERHNRQLSQFRVEFVGKEKPDMSVKEMEEKLADYRQKLVKIGDVNLGAIEEYDELKERFDFLCEQRDDLLKAMNDLHKVIKKINKVSQEKFLKTFEQVNEKLGEVFPQLFGGGSAKLTLTDPGKPLDSGVEFMVHPLGKRLTRLTLLSGGEKALSAIAFVFSIFLIKPASFCIMDEIDAPLDEANVLRFNDLLKIIGEKSQIIMITHKRKSMEFADMLFGVTMEQKGISRIVSVNLEKAEAASFSL